MIKDKKAVDYSFFLVIVVIIVLSALFIAIYTIGDRHDFKLGETQAALFNTFYSSESMLFFVDQAAKYSAYQSLSELPSVDKGCGKLDNIPIFNNKENPLNICLFDATELFKNLLNKKLNNYFEQYSTYNISKDNYEFLLLNDSIKAIALEPVYVGVFMPSRKIELKFLGITFKSYPLASYQFGRYFIKPSFSLDLNHNIFFYEEIQSRLNQTINDCALKFNQTEIDKKLACINNFNFKTKTNDNDTFVFEFPQNIKNPFNQTDFTIGLVAFIPSLTTSP